VRAGTMLLNEEKKTELVNSIIAAARLILKDQGSEKKDKESGLVHLECRPGPFLLIEHQRQELNTGWVKTNGLDLWELTSEGAKKRLSVNYIPFHIRVFYTAGKATWIEEFLNLSKGT